MTDIPNPLPNRDPEQWKRWCEKVHESIREAEDRLSKLSYSEKEKAYRRMRRKPR